MNIKRAIQQRVGHEDAKHFHIAAHKGPLGNYHKIEMTFPHDVVNIEDKGDLMQLLDHYGSHHTSWKNLIPDSQFARRWYVEKIRPTLRHYCKKYQVNIPAWLQNDDLFLKMDSTAKHKLFGAKELKPITYGKFENQAIHEHDDDEAGEKE